MIKRIIFDLDNTLISGIDFKVMIKDALIKRGMPCNEEIIKQIADYTYIFQSTSMLYEKDNLINYIRMQTGIETDSIFWEIYFEEICNVLPENVEDGVISTLEYLCQKYSLCVLSNWFVDSQLNRLKNAGLVDYFDNVYGAEVYKKPQKEAYRYACGEYKKRESLMVGDSYVYDYIGPKMAGLNAIYLDKHEDKPKMKNRIIKLDDLKKIL